MLACESHRQHAFEDKDYTINNSERIKNNKYAVACTERNVDFLPLVIEAFGRPSKNTVDLVKRLVGKASNISQIPFHILLFYWKKRISTSLQNMNARTIAFDVTFLINSGIPTLLTLMLKRDFAIHRFLYIYIYYMKQNKFML